MIVDREKVRRSLEGLDGEGALRRLLVRELGYDYEGGSISSDGLPAGVEEEIAADPTLIASTAREGRFTVKPTAGRPDPKDQLPKLRAGLEPARSVLASSKAKAPVPE